MCGSLACMYYTHMPPGYRGQKRSSNPMEMELQTAVSFHGWESNPGPLEVQPVFCFVCFLLFYLFTFQMLSLFQVFPMQTPIPYPSPCFYEGAPLPTHLAIPASPPKFP